MRIAAIILAAGRSSRFVGGNKLLAPLDGKPLIRHVVEIAGAVKPDDILIVTGHAADEVASALEGLEIRIVHNRDYADGMASSLFAGIAGLPEAIDAAFLMLGDMPQIALSTLESLIAAAKVMPMPDAFIPVHNGRRGNPVLVRARLFAAFGALSGDAGARRLFETMPERVAEIIVADPGIHADFDTREALENTKPQHQ